MSKRSSNSHSISSNILSIGPENHHDAASIGKAALAAMRKGNFEEAEDLAATALAILNENQAILAEELADMKQLRDISMQLIEENNPNNLYSHIIDAAINLMHADMGTIQAFDSEKGELELLAWYGLVPESAAFWQRVRSDSGTSCSAALHSGGRAIIPDVETSEYVVGKADLEHYQKCSIRSIQSTPLLARDGHLVGMLSTLWHKPHVPSERELRMFDVLARQAADLVDRARVEAQREAALASLEHARQELEQRVAERTTELTKANQELRWREAELTYQAVILAHINDAVIATNKDRLITYMNPAAVEQYGWKIEEAMGRNPVHLFRAEFVDTTDLEFAESVERTGRWRGEVIVHRKDGTTFYADATAVALFDETGSLIGHIGVHHDITARKKAEAELKASREKMRGYSRRLVEAIENEQRNLARELHDQAGQSLSVLKLLLGRLRREVNNGHKSSAQFEAIGELIDTVMDDLHRLAVNLRPVSLDRHGLLIALQQYVGFFRRQSGIDVDLIDVGIDEQRLPPDVETAIYRVAQEALINVSRHANAKHVVVTLERRPDRVIATVYDDGCGFDMEAASRSSRLGLLGMQERAEMLGGTFKIESSPGKGTMISVDLPCKSAEKSA